MLACGQIIRKVTAQRHSAIRTGPSGSDKAHSVTFARLDFARLAATRARRAAALMHAPSLGASRPRFVHPLSPASTRPLLHSARSCDVLPEDRYEDLR